MALRGPMCGSWPKPTDQNAKCRDDVKETTDRADLPVRAPLGFCAFKDDGLNQFFVSADSHGSGVAAALIADAERCRDRLTRVRGRQLSRRTWSATAEFLCTQTAAVVPHTQSTGSPYGGAARRPHSSSAPLRARRRYRRLRPRPESTRPRRGP